MLSFRVTARLGGVGRLAGPQQLIQARIFLRGRQARVESMAMGTPVVVLLTSPYLYRLLPASRAGVRWKLDPQQPSNFSNFDAQALLRDPALLKKTLVQSGAKKTTGGALNGVKVDVYEGHNLGGQRQNIKVWLRHSDALPLRLEASGAQVKIIASWRDYVRSAQANPALFTPPKNFRIRENAGQPPFSMF